VPFFEGFLVPPKSEGWESRFNRGAAIEAEHNLDRDQQEVVEKQEIA